MAFQVPRYQYRPVDSAGGEIRLLTIRPGPFNAPLDLYLDIYYRVLHPAPRSLPGSGPASKSPRHARTYEALSYAWGSPHDTVDIPIGITKEHLSVGRNLAIALPFIRLPDKDRVIWIDAICIDQSNFQERGLQVQLMAEIYQQAARVVCWVGLESGNSELAIRTIRDMSSRVDVDIPTQTTTPRGDENRRWADASEPLSFDTQVLHALYDFYGRSWFERLWVFQEILLAGNRAQVQCGTTIIEWQALTTASWCFHNMPWGAPVPSDFALRLEMVRQMYNTNPTNLALLIRRTVNFKCSDPRDRVYALMSLRRNDERPLQIKVDYTKSAGKVYHSYVDQYIRVLKSLRLLSFCELQRFSPDRPTWVPDWSRPQHANAPRAQQYAAGYMLSDGVRITGNVLKVTGVLAGTVQKMTAMDIGNGSEEAAIALIRKCAPPGVLERPYPENRTMLEAYCSTMCHNTFSNQISPERILFPSFHESLSAVKAFIEEPSVGIQAGSSASRYCKLVSDICAGRSFIFTSDGRIGLAPDVAQPGDHLAVILGCRSLILLRPSNGQYQVVGLAYVHGLNNGEPLFGPLPSHFRPVLQCENGYFTKQLFFDNCNGELLHEDPRFVDFAKAEMATGLYFGEKAPTTDALESRGVPLRTFELI